MDKTNEKKDEKKTEKPKKEKKEKKFNGDRVARIAKNSLKAVFPNETFIVSSFVDRIEVLYPANSKITPAELGMFKTMFKNFVSIKPEQFTISQYEKKAV